MSRLKLFSRNSFDVETQTSGDEPVILSLKSYKQLLDDGKMNHVVDRARRIHNNNRCPHCSHPLVEPIELDDAILNRNRMPIPGTATLVGFHCHGCQREWPV
jgi:hypothetical protein